MPSELRILRFGLDEAASALRMLAPRIGIRVPDIAFASAEAVLDSETPGTCFNLGGSGGQFTVTNGQLAASFFYYCDHAGLQLPRDGKKEIYVSPGFIELRIAVQHCAAAPAKQAYPQVGI